MARRDIASLRLPMVHRIGAVHGIEARDQSDRIDTEASPTPANRARTSHPGLM